MSNEQQNALEQLDQLNIQAEEISEMVTQLEHSVSEDVYRQLQQHIQELQTTINSLSTDIENLQSENNVLRTENETLRGSLQDCENTQQTLEQAQRRIIELERQVDEFESSDSHISGGMVFGVNAKLGIAIIWKEDVDVDLHVKNIATGEVCNFSSRTYSWGNYLEDIMRRSSDDDRYELFYQKQIVPGQYQISINIFSSSQRRWNNIPANVSGFMVINPGKRNQKKIVIPEIRLSQPMNKTNIGTLTVTEDDIYLQ